MVDGEPMDIHLSLLFLHHERISPLLAGIFDVITLCCRWVTATDLIKRLMSLIDTDSLTCKTLRHKALNLLQLS